MAGESQASVGRRWIGALVGILLGVAAGWLWGRSVAQSAQQTGGPVPGLAVTVGLWVLAIVVVILAVAAAILFLSPRRRRLSVAMVAAAAGWVGGYAIALAMGYP
jgi:hypothetical protein